MSSRQFSADDLPAGAPSQPFRAIEARLRCTSTGKNKRQPPCGGRMEIEIITPHAGHVVLRDGA